MDGEQPWHLRKVPMELWEKIFAIACSLTKRGYSLAIISEFYTGQQIEIEAFPIVLTHVCSRWRQIVIRCPKLWASINVTPSEAYPEGRREKKLLELYLANSARHPLDIRLHLKDVGMTMICEIFMGHFSRFERLRLDCPIPAFRNGYAVPGGINHPFWQALHHAPKLTEVQTYHPYPRDLLPYQKLTTLVVGVIGEGDVENLLLLDCFRAANRPLGAMRRSVELPSLRTLSVSSDICWWDGLVEMDNPILGIFFASLILPFLSTFELRSTASSSSHQTSWPSSLLIMLEHSSATLRHMSLSVTFYIPWEPLSVLLKTTPHITHLKLKKWFLPASFIASFLSDLADTRQLGTIIPPELTHLALAAIHMTPKVVEMVIATATSRRPPAVRADVICPLEELCLELQNPNDLQIPHILEGLKRNGIKIDKPDW